MAGIVTFTGAGISKASGIPTFEELGNIRDKLTRDFFNENPAEFYNILKSFKDRINDAEPNTAHTAIARHGIAVITMNVDSLHEKAGSKGIIEVHGNLKTVSCIKCRKTYDFSVLYDSINCCVCNSIYEPDVVLYGDLIRDYFKALDIIGGAGNLLVVGTSFYTSTASDFANRARRAGIKVDIINQNAEELVPEYLEKNMGSL